MTKSEMPSYRDPHSPSGYKEGVSNDWPQQDRHRRKPQPDGSRGLKSKGALVDPTLVAESGKAKPTL